MKIRDIVKELTSYYSFKVEECPIYRLSRELTSYEFLILTVLSQNTSDKLAKRAFDNLVQRFGRPLDPHVIVESPEAVIDCIRVSGMYKRKYETIRNLSLLVIERGQKFLDNDDPRSIMKILLSIEGLGRKSVDVFLLFKRCYPTFPVDTHIRRISSRIPLTREASYDAISGTFLREFGSDPHMLMTAHLVLIKHGRELCRALSPRCDICPLRNVCEYARSRNILQNKRL
ncbi:MAG: endonuclease III [Crenarchaeota archaeon]|nr:endonuclease III [Thermoproteota archaeon]